MKRFARKSAAMALAAILFVSLFTAAFCPVNASAADPTLLFDLDFTKDRQAADASGNWDVELFGGVVDNVEVKVGDVNYTAAGYRAVNPSEFLQLNLTTAAGIGSGEDLGKIILDGFTMELYIQLDVQTTGTAALFGSCYKGGVMLYSQKKGSACFFVGSEGGNTSAGAEFGNENYAYSNTKNIDATSLPAGELIQVVGVMNKETNKVQLYLNGQLLSEGTYGTGEFKVGNMQYDTFGIGLNPSYISEETAKYTPYTVLEARMYKTALSADMIQDAYIEMNSKVTGNQAAMEFDAVTEAPKTEAPKTEAPVVTEAPAATDAPATQAPAATDKPAEKSGCGSAVTGMGCALLLLPTAWILRKKHSRG